MPTLKLKTKLAIALVLILNFSMSATALAANTDPCQSTIGSNGSVSQPQVDQCVSQSPFVAKIQTIVDFLSVGVGIIVTAVILVGGIQYIIAGDNPQQLTAARQRITNGVIALFAFIFMFALLQWLIPGGIFK